MNPALSLFLAALPVSAAIYLYASRSFHNEIITLYLVLFVLEMFAYGIVSVEFSTHEDFSTGLILMVAALLYVYVGSTILYASLLRKYSREIRLTAFAIPDEHLVIGIGGWLALKSALYAFYGAAVFGALETRVHAGVPQLLVDLDRFLLWPAWGAYFLYVIRLGPSSSIRLTSYLCTAFLLLNLFFENNGGGKRLLLTTAIIFLLFHPHYSGSKIRMAIMWILFLTLMPIGANYYERVRENFGEVTRRAQAGDDLTWDGLASALVPRQGAGVEEELKGRDAPIVLLYDITRVELQEGKVARGALVGQVVENVLPSGMFNKHVEDEDSILSAIFNLPAVDLATSALAVIQAETFLFAYVVTPVIYVLLFGVYLHLLATRMTIKTPGLWNSIESLAIVGVLMITAVEIETGLTGLLAALRDLMGIIGVGYLYRLASLPARQTHISGSSPSTFPASR